MKNNKIPHIRDANLLTFADQTRKVLGWTPKYNDLDTIVRTSLDWERKIAARDPSAYWAT